MASKISERTYIYAKVAASELPHRYNEFFFREDLLQNEKNAKNAKRRILYPVLWLKSYLCTLEMSAKSSAEGSLLLFLHCSRVDGDALKIERIGGNGGE